MSADGHIGSADSDVLAFYAPELAAAGANTNTAEDRLVSMVSILVGLGVRESSDLHCRGADTPEDRGAPTTEADAEAGLFQVSWDSIHGDALRQSLFDAYRGRSDLLDIFREGATCGADDWNNVGTSDGAVFQDTMKKNPLFAVLYASVFLRVARNAWGPINHKAAKVMPDAVTLFNAIRAMP